MRRPATIPAQRWLVDEGVSGRTAALDRPAFARLVDRLEAGDTVVVSKLDRLGRDSRRCDCLRVRAFPS